MDATDILSISIRISLHFWTSAELNFGGCSKFVRSFSKI
jgi:hypothetical protein